MDLETSRLVLRSVREKDAEALSLLWSDPKVTLYSGGPRRADLVKNAVKEDAQLPTPLPRSSVFLKSGDALIGDCGLIEKEVEGKKAWELIYYFFPSAWGQGYATEAAQAVISYAGNVLRVKSIIALIHPQNAASEKVAIKLQFIFSGMIKRGESDKKLYKLSLQF